MKTSQLLQRKLPITLCVLLLVFGLSAAMAKPLQVTEAAWADKATSAGNFTAMTMPQPLPLGSPSCTVEGLDIIVFLPSAVVINWTLPEDLRTHASKVYLVVAVEDDFLSDLGNLLLGSGAATRPLAGTDFGYQTRLTENVLSGLFDLLLGGGKGLSLYLSLEDYDSDTWATAWKSEALDFSITGGGRTCNVVQ